MGILLLSWQQAERSNRMYDYSSDSSVLSVIARGRGLLEGGVELDCINTETAFSLSVSHRLTYTDLDTQRCLKLFQV